MTPGTQSANIILLAGRHETNTRFYVLADTFDDGFLRPSTLTPRIDVILHCGGLSAIRDLESYRKVIKCIERCQAELALIIPGDHDVSLDPKWWAQNMEEDDQQEPEPDGVRALFSNRAGIRLLSEGIHKFTLRSGATFRIYASSYTPGPHDYAFAYDREEDRFNVGAEHPIPYDEGGHCHDACKLFLVSACIIQFQGA